MSCFVCSDKTFIALGLYAASNKISTYSLDRAFAKKGVSLNSSELNEIQLANIIAQELHFENVKSFNHLYNSDEQPDRVEVPHDAGLRTVVNNPVHILSICGCVDYQSSEHPEYLESTALEVLGLIKDIAIRNLPGYRNAPWDLK